MSNYGRVPSTRRTFLELRLVVVVVSVRASFDAIIIFGDMREGSANDWGIALLRGITSS